MKISASVYSSKSHDLEGLVEELQDHRVDMLHIDCNDNPSVFDDIRAIRLLSDIPIDLHLITNDPEKYFDLLRANPVEYVNVQYEELKNFKQFPADIEGKKGLAITSETDLEVFEEYANNFDHILFMATIPGQSGGKFDKTNFRKIRNFRALYPGKRIHVDGGVNAEVSFILRNMGVYAAVVGSYLFSEKLGAALLNLQTHDIDSHFLVSDFMREKDELPLVNLNKLDLQNVLQTIEDYKIAFTLVVEDSDKLVGLISNADIRRAMLRNIDNLNNLNVIEMINKNPVVINENKTVMELLKFIKSQNININYLPVINNKQEVTGAISFTNLIKGEL